MANPSADHCANHLTIFKQLKIISVTACALLLAACSSSGGGGSTSAPDAYEPDDSFAAASSMAVNSSQNHNHYDDISDYVKFDAIAGYQYTISTSNLGSEADTIIELYNSSYSILARNDDINFNAGNLASNIVWTASSSGTYYVLVDGWLAGPSTEYTLNISAVAPPPQPELVMGSMSVPTSVAINSLLTFSDTVTNQGNANAGGFDVDYYISTNAIISTGDTYLGSRRIASLGAGASSTVSSSFAIPGTLTQGNYYIGALVDTGYEVAELDETNNTGTAYALTIAPPLPADLTISGVTATASVPAGETVTVTDTVTNSGYDAYGVDVYYYLSADAIIDGVSDIYLGSRTIASIGTVNDVNSGLALKLPRDFVQGSYFLGAIVDPLNTVVENNDTDNISNTVPVTVTAPIPSDLVFTTFTPDTIVNTWNQMTISDTVSNQGSGNENGFTISYYLSTDNIVDGTDTLLGTRTVASLAAGASNSGSITPSINRSVGTYYVYAIIDTAGVAIESDTLNNTSLVTMITVVNPDLSMGTFTVSPTSVQAGSSVTLSDNVSNIGTADITDSFTINYYLSVDSIVTTTDTYLGSRTVNGLAAGAVSSGSFAATVPSSLAAGTSGNYYVAAIADPYNYLSDGNTTNNSGSAVVVSVTGCSPDGYEEDDVYTSAKPIGVGATQSGRNFCLDASDWLSFTATAGVSYTIRITTADTFYPDTIAEVFGSDGVTSYAYDDVAGPGLDALISNWVAPASGTYYIQASSRNTGNLTDYSITLTAQ